MKRVLLSYCERNKPVKLPDNKEDSDLVFLQKKFQDLYSYDGDISSVTFQRYNEEWGTTLEIDESDTIEDMDKLQVVVLEKPHCSDSNSSAMESAMTSSSLTNTCGSLSDSDSNSPVHAKKRPAIVYSENEDNEINDNPETPKLPKIKRITEIVKSEEDKIPLPNPFPLPKHYDAEVECALKNKKMTSGTRKAFIAKVASAILCYKRYPTSDDYTNVGYAITQAYPFMKSPAGPPAGAIINSLKNAFKEFRRDKSKKRVKSTAPTRGAEKPLTPGRDVKLSMPEIPKGEDEVSFGRHTKVLQNEYKKQHPNQQVVEELTAASFALRRKDILEHTYDLNSLLTKYPFLRCAAMLVKEMQMIVNDSHWIESVQCKWDELKSKIVHQGSLEAPNKAKLRGIVEELTENADDSIVGLVMLPYLLPDARCSPDHEKVLYFTKGATNVEGIAREKGQLQPYVISTGNISSYGQLYLIVDRQVVCEVDITRVPLILVCAYFVYNICYIKGCNNFYSFLEYVFLNSSLEKCASSVKHLLTVFHHLE